MYLLYILAHAENTETVSYRQVKAKGTHQNVDLRLKCYSVVSGAGEWGSIVCYTCP